MYMCKTRERGAERDGGLGFDMVQVVTIYVFCTVYTLTLPCYVLLPLPQYSSGSMHFVTMLV